MKKYMTRLVALMLVLSMLLGQGQPIIAKAVEVGTAHIVSAQMGTDSGGVSNLEGYYSNEEWAKDYPDGLFLVEYNSYEINEGGTDPQNPEDVSLGVVVYRIGGNSMGATVSYSLTCIHGDKEIYPNSIGSVWFAPQQSTAIIKVKIPNDAIRNGNQVLMLTLDSATTGTISNANIAMIGVTDDEPYVQSEVSMVLSEAVVDKSAGGVKITVKRTNNSVDLCTLKIFTADGTAIAGKDYETVEQEVVFMKDQTEQTITIPLIQSEDVYTDSKYLTVTMSEMKGCKAVSGETIRVNITNKCEEGTKKPVSVDGLKPDVEVDTNGALANQGESVVNVNDSIDRLALLRTVVGTANGTAVQSMSCGTQLASSETGYWKPTVVIPNTSFYQKYKTGDEWVPGEEYTDGNENLLLLSALSYDLNRFYAMEPHFYNKRYEGAVLSYPNTAFGYLSQKSPFMEKDFPKVMKHDYTNSSASDRAYMDEKQIYYFKNWNYTDVDLIDHSIKYELTAAHPHSTGKAAMNQKLFYMLYSDEEWESVHFMLGDTLLYRAILPFSLFDASLQNDAMTGFQVVVNESNPNTGYIQFEMDGFIWRIRADESLGGGVGKIPDVFAGEPLANRYGFYVGSNLEIQCKPVAASANMPVPAYFYLVEEGGGIHQAAALSESGQMSSDGFRTVGSIPLATLLNNEVDTLADSYCMTDEEINKHNALVNADQIITRGFQKKLYFRVKMSQESSVVLNYGALPTLVEKLPTVTGQMENDIQQAERISGILKNVVKFFDENDKEISVRSRVDLKNQRIEFDRVGFAYLIVEPETAGGGTRIKSNLYDQDMSDFAKKTKIGVEDCAQVGRNVIFDIYTENLTYLPPHITVDWVGVSSRVGGSFRTEYVADSLAKYMNFEVLHHDTEKNPALSYYTVRFTISDIYAANAKRQVKEYPVTVWYERTDGTEREELLRFVFKGGAALVEAQDTQMEILCDAYTAVDKSMVPGADAAGYKPFLTLLDYSSKGYQYELHIPTYYDYQAKDSALMQTYTQRFYGADGISIVMQDFDRGDNSLENNMIFTLDTTDMPHVATYVPAVDVETEGADMVFPYREEQRKFYTYTDYTTGWSIANIGVDTAPFVNNISRGLGVARKDGVASALADALWGSGLYGNFNGDQFYFGLRVAVGNAHDLQGDKTANLQGAFNADHTLSNFANRWNAGKFLSYGATFDIRFTFDYNQLTHVFEFSQFKFTGNVNLSLSKAIPIPALANAVYVSLGFSAGADVSLSGNNVLDYVDENGTGHFKVTFGGAYVEPMASLSAGVGAGIMNVLSLEAGITASLSLRFALASSDSYESPQRVFDIDSVKGATADKYSIEFSDGWHTYTPSGINTTSYSFGNTLCESETKGDTIVIKGTGTSFQLTGLACPEGGEMEITVTDNRGSEPKRVPCSNYSSRNELEKLLYYWQCADNYTEAENVKFTVTITNTSGKRISLDSFRVYNKDYEKHKYTEPFYDSYSFRIAMYVRLSVLIFNFGIDPAWLLIEGDPKGGSVTIGCMDLAQQVWEWQWDNATDVDEAAADALPLMLATRSNTLASSTKPDYFNTGAYSDYRTQQLLQADISNAAKPQVLSYGGHTYTFYTVMGAVRSGTSFYQLYCSVDGREGRLVCDDLFVADFEAFVDGKGNLSVAMTCSDSTISSMAVGTDGKVTMTTADGTTYPINTAKELREALIRTRVKLLTLELGADGTVTDSTFRVLGSTDSGDPLQDSNPVGVSVPGGSCVIYNTASSSDPAGVTTDWESFLQNGSDPMNDLLSALYQGNSELYCTVVTDSGAAVTTQIPLSEQLTGMKDAIITVTSVDAISQGNTVALAYTVEVDNGLQGGRKGVLKQSHYRQLTVAADGSVQVSKTVVVDSVFDYDDQLASVFGQNPQSYPAQYYNEKTGEIYESNILRNVQLERAVLGGNGTAVGSDAMVPCLFYQTNASINCITFDTLQKLLDGTATENDKVGVLYEGSFDAYVIAVSPEGAISLVYNDCSKTSAYTDTLYLIDYCPDFQVWNKARQLTYTDVFDEMAFRNHQPTGSLAFDDLCAFVDENGKVTIALKSSYAPFTYEYGARVEDVTIGDRFSVQNYYDAVVQTEDGKYVPYMTTPIQDYRSEAARTDVYMITFADRVMDVDVTGLTLDNELFLPGQKIGAEVEITNTGDYLVQNLTVTLYHMVPGRSPIPVATQKLTTDFLSGDTITAELSYTVGAEGVENGTMLGVMVTGGPMEIQFYDSYEDCYLLNHDDDSTNDREPTYRIIKDAAEFYFHSTRVDIDSSGMMSYSVCLGNLGTLDAKEDVTVYLRLYSYDPETGKATPGSTLFGFRVSASMLAAGVTHTVSDTYDVRNYLKEGELRFAFELVAQDEQFTTLNDCEQMQLARQIPEVVVDNVQHQSGSNIFSDGRVIYQLTLGQELEIDTNVLAQAMDVSSLRFYEIGTSCLSIDASAQNGKAKVKVVELPNGQEGYVKLLVKVDGTVINRYLYLHITNRETIDLKEENGDGNWSLSGACNAYAIAFDLLCTETDGSTLEFDFYGGDFRLYGDRLTDGGKFELIVRNAQGKEMVRRTVSTKAELDDFGMMLTECHDLPYDHYTVTIKAMLAAGERLALDNVRHLIDSSDADTTPYTVVQRTRENLDVPLLSGRNRDATFKLVFTDTVELAEGARLEEITVNFAEFELVDDRMVPTGRTVTFTASQIDGRELVLKAKLASAPGVIRVYELADRAIPAGCLISNGQPVDTSIPNPNAVTYMLKESGIMSVMVADDPDMPSGSIRKSVQVKFMTAPDVSRLEGTKLLYITDDPDGTQRPVEFHYAGLMDDPRVAVYRADELTLQREELTKLFRYQEGIILNRNNYVLVTKDGDYLENDITTVISDGSLLDIAYTKLRAERSRITLADGMLRLTVDYPEPVSAAAVEAWVQVKRTVKDIASGTSTDSLLTLPLIRQESDGKTLTFAAAEEQSFPAGMTVIYELVSETIAYGSEEQSITRGYDGIAINPAIPAAEELVFGTDGWIIGAEPFVDEQGMIGAEVTFSTLMDETTLAQTGLELEVRVAEYDETKTQTAPLTFRSARTVEGRTVAIYGGEWSAKLAYQQTGMTYLVPASLLVDAGEQLRTADGNGCGSAILDPKSLTIARTQAQSAQISLRPGKEYGQDVVLTVQFDTALTAWSMTNVFASVDMETTNGSERLYLSLEAVEGSTLTFATKTPVVLPGNAVITFKAVERFADLDSAIRDSRGLGVSERLPETSMTCSTEGSGGIAWAKLQVEKTEGNRITVSFRAIFNANLSKQAFNGSSVVIAGSLTYADGTSSQLEKTVEFTGVENGFVAVYTTTLELPGDVDGAQLYMASEEIQASSPLYNEDYSVKLSPVLPQLENLSILKPKADSSSAQAQGSEAFIDVSYAEPITAEDLENITLTADVSGKPVVFTGYRVSGNVLRLRAQGITTPVTIRVTDGMLKLAGQAALYATESGLAVSLAVPDLEQTFGSGGTEEVPPTDDSKLVYMAVLLLVAVAAVLIVVRKRRFRVEGKS